MSQDNNLIGERAYTRPSRLYLAKLESPPATILDHLIARFPQIDPRIWRERVLRGVITLSDGTTLQVESPYRHGITVFYQKEVPSEATAVEEPSVIYRDEEVIVVDKPHGMAVTPSGEHVDRSLLAQLERSTGLTSLSAIHRLDRETAGLLLLTIKADARAHYHKLFADGKIEREYLAVAHITDRTNQTRWRVTNRIESGDPWYLQRIVEGPANAITDIELLDLHENTGLFRLLPQTGKKHQLRVHMASIGFPIVGDPFYPKIKDRRQKIHHCNFWQTDWHSLTR